MKKKILSLLLASIMVMGAFAGCAKQEEPVYNEPIVESENLLKTKESDTRIVVDHFGFEVEIPKKIEKVAVVWLLPLPSVLAVYQGGNVDNLVGMPPDSLNAAENSILAEYCPEILNVSTEFYKGGELNMEELLNLEPDVVFYSGKARAELFQNAGIPAIGFETVVDGNVSPVNTLNEWLILLEEVFQEESKTQGIMEYAEKTEKEIMDRVAGIPEDERKNVLMLGHYMDTTITPGSFSIYWCEAVGANCASLNAEQAEINMEQVYEWAPDVVILSTLAQFYPDDLYNNTAGTGHDWSTVPAIETGDVYKFPLGTHRWWPPSSDAPLALWWLAKTIYPEHFEDIDLNEKVKEYYEGFYGMTLTDEDVESILFPNEGLGRRFS